MRRFHQIQYAAGSWARKEEVIARVEATALGTEVRFIVTNLPDRAKVLSEKVYRARGRMENLIKDLKLYTRTDKTACHRWEANKFRLFPHAGAYSLLLRAAGCAEMLTLAWRDLRDDPRPADEDRSARRGVSNQDQAVLPATTAARQCAGPDRRSALPAGTVSDVMRRTNPHSTTLSASRQRLCKISRQSGRRRTSVEHEPSQTNT